MAGGRVINVSGKTGDEIFTATNPGFVTGSISGGGNSLTPNPDGSINTVLTGSNAPLPNVLLADGKTIPNTSIFANVPMLHNGSTLDIQRGNTQGVLLASAARTATTNTANQTNYNARGALFILDVTANPGGAETLAVVVKTIDSSTGIALAITSFPTTTAATNARYMYFVYPGAIETTATANLEVQAIPLTRTFVVTVFHSSTGSWTYALSHSLIL